MTFKTGELFRTYYYEETVETGEFEILFSQMIDKMGRTPDQIGDYVYEFKELDIHFGQQQNQNTTLVIEKLVALYSNYGDTVIYNPVIGAVEDSHTDETDLRSRIDTSPVPNYVDQFSSAQQKEDWKITIENMSNCTVTMALVVRCH